MSRPFHLALEKNLALMAGAGAGKTYSLVTMTLHLLAGAREGAKPLRPARLCMVTFTDKAAAEMRARVRARLDALVQAEPKALLEPELRESLERLGQPFPTKDTWRALREELGSASVGTFHSLCGQLLRRAPPGSGVDASFEVLDELEARTLVLDVCERVVLDALEAGDAGVRELCQELTFSGSDFTEGLVSSLSATYGKLREEGLRAAEVRISSVEEMRAGFEALVERCQGLCATVRELDKKGEWRELREKLEAALEGLTPENCFEPERLPSLKAAFLEDDRKVHLLKKEPGNSVKELYWHVFAKSKKKGETPPLLFEDIYASWRTAPFEDSFRSLLSQVEKRHEEEFARRNALDFTALLVKTRDLLRDLPDYRRQVQERLGALMVDEFQDTNRLQLELVLLLAEKREEGPRPVRPDESLVDALPLEPAFLCAVGDRKQSIYEFRGADVSVFEVLAKKIESEGGVRDFLQHNRRSVPPLLDFFNHAFAGVLVGGEGGARPYEVVYVPKEDDLSAVRPELVPAPVVERLVLDDEELSTGELRAADAESVAKRLKVMLAPGAEPLVAREDQEGLRPVRGGDVAMLFRTFTHLEVYRQALIRHGIPHRVLRGRGFYGAQEVLDLASLLSLLADPEDTLAFAAVLRSPMVGLSDASLFRLAGPEGLSLSAVERGGSSSLEGLPEGERARLERFLTALPSLRRERDRLGVRALLLAAMEVTGYRESLAGTPYAEQASANVEKLLSLAGRRDERGTGGCVTFARELQRLANEEPTEAQADLLEAGDPRAVQLLTIHRAKGLEWPVVMVPALGSLRRFTSGRALFERTHGLCLRPWLPDSLEKYRSPRYDEVKDELRRRETAEYRRVLYVALTRARDRLILSGGEERGASDSWWCLLDERLGEDTRLRGLVEDLDVETLPAPPEMDEPEAVDLSEQEARVEAALQRVHDIPALATPEVAAVGTEAVQDFVVCPRRYRYVHQLGLRAEGAPWETPPRVSPLYIERDAWGAPALGVSDRELALLRVVDFRLAGTPPTERRGRLEALVREVGWDLGEDGVEEALATVERFLGTAFARRLAAVPVSTVHRALPFVLSLPGEAPAALEGEVDLLWQTPAGEARVVVFKPGKRPPRGVEAHAESLAAVLLAARRLVREDVPVEVGVAFLGEDVPEPEFPAPAVDMQVIAERLREAARGLVEADVQGRWPGREPSVCQTLACGYAGHCHSVALPTPGR